MNESEEKLDQPPGPVTTSKPKSPVVQALSSALRFWWIPVSYGIPAFCAYQYGVYNSGVMDAQALFNNNIDGALKIGQLGLGAAVLVWVIWRLDTVIGAKQKLAHSEFVVKLLLHLSGFALWLCWFCAFVIISMAYDQVYNMPDTMPNLPG